MLPFLPALDDGPVVSQLFASTLYTGNGAIRTITTGINLSTPGGAVWTKARSAGENHSIANTVVGADKDLITNGTSVEQNPSNTVTAFGTTGHNLGTSVRANANLTTYVAWSFARAPRFFDVVTYTGNGSGSQAVAHGLGVKPGAILVKATSTTGNWCGWFRSSDTNGKGAISLNLTSSSGQDIPTSLVTTATEFYPQYVQDASTNIGNSNGVTYVAYLFAHDTAGDGIVQCGSYTGNGSASGPTVTLGWNPQWVMIKRSSNADGWAIFDTARGIPSGDDPSLFANTADAENGTMTLGDRLDLTGTGFQLATNTGILNGSGDTYIYMAVRAA